MPACTQPRAVRHRMPSSPSWLSPPPHLTCSSSSSSRRQHRCTSLLPSSPLPPFTVTASVLSSPSPLPTANATELLSPFSLSVAVIPTPSPSSPALPPTESHPRPSFFLHEPRRRRLPPSTPSLTVDLLRLRRRTPSASPTSPASLSLLRRPSPPHRCLAFPLLSPSVLLRPFGHRSHPSTGSSAVTRIRRLSLFSFFRSSNAPDLAADLPFFLNLPLRCSLFPPWSAVGHLLLPPLPAVAAVLFPRCRRAPSSLLYPFSVAADHPTECHRRLLPPPCRPR